MKTVINNEGVKVLISEETYNDLSKMRLDESALIKVNGQTHMIIISDNF